MFTRFQVATFLPDGSVHRKNYLPPPGGYVTQYMFEAYLNEHRKLLAPLGIKCREVQTGPNSFSFIHPGLDKEKAA